MSTPSLSGAAPAKAKGKRPPSAVPYCPKAEAPEEATNAEKALSEGHLRLEKPGRTERIFAVAAARIERWSDPEEKIRAESDAELIDAYGSAPQRIGVEVRVPDREPGGPLVGLDGLGVDDRGGSARADRRGVAGCRRKSAENLLADHRCPPIDPVPVDREQLPV